MSKFKRALSMLLAVVMVFGSISCLGAVVAPKASAAEGTSGIKSYESLAAQYDDFIYLGTEVYEIKTSDGTLAGTVTESALTDYYVDAGQLLEFKLYIKSDMYAGNSTIIIRYDNAFFDVTQTTSSAPNKNGYTNGLAGVTNPAHPTVDHNKIKYNAMSSACSSASWIVNMSGYAATDIAKWDFTQAGITYDSSAPNDAYEFTSDEWFISWYAKVKNVETGATGTTDTKYGFWKCDDNTAETVVANWNRRNANIPYKPKSEASSAIVSDTASMYTNYGKMKAFLIDDLSHTFTCGTNPADAGSEPVPGVSKIKSYESLAAQYDDFIYLGTEIYEIETSDGTLAGTVTDSMLTDYYVDAGQLLEFKLYIKSDMYAGNSTIIIRYDNAFFDVTQTTSSAPNKNGYTNGLAGVTNPAHPTVDHNKIKYNAMSSACSSASWIVNMSGYAATDIAKWDFTQAGITYDSSAPNDAYEFTSDEWFISWYAKVKNVETGATGTTDTKYGFWKCDDNTAETVVANWNRRNANIPYKPKSEASSAIVSDTASMYTNYGKMKAFLIDDLSHTFTCGKPPAAGSYTAKFVADGTEVSSAAYATGAEIAAPATNPTKDGYVFKGWALEGTTDVLTFPQTMGSANVVYVAIFEEVQKYTATFVVDGVTVDTASLEAGAAITFPTVSNKTGYSANGWLPAVTTMPAEDTTFTLQWKANTYNVYFYAEKGDATPHATLTVSYDGAYTLPASFPNKTGYTATSWVDANGNAMPATHTVDGAVSFYANWVAGIYTATFKANGGVFAETGTDTYTVDVEFNKPITPPAAPTKTGNVFLGWTPEVGSMTSTGMTFTAQWKAATVAVYFMDGNEVVEEKTGDYGSQISPSQTPGKDGYTFAGWVNANDEPVSFPITLGSEPVYVYATWTANPFYIEFYNGSKWLSGGDQLCGDPIVTPSAPSQTGYEFTGWADADGNPMPETVPAISNQVYYAQFTPIMYVATFDADGGVFAETNTDTYTYEGIYNSTIVKPANPTKEGHSFNKWSPTVPTRMPAKNATYTALWNVLSYTIEYYVDDTLEKTETYQYGAAITPWTPTVEDGKNFSGWGNQIPATMPAENLKVYGTTGAETFNVTFTINGEEFTVVPVAFGSAITAPDYTAKEGHSFSGWDLSAYPTMPAQNITINATETPNTYYAIFYLDDAKTEEYAKVPTVYGAAIEMPDEPIVLGKYFEGWDIDAPETMPANNVEFVALFSDIEYYVEFYNADGEVVYDDLYFWGDVIEEDVVPVVEKEGFEFKYWTVNGSAVSFPLTIDEAIADNDNTTIALEPFFAIEGFDVIYYVDGEIYAMDTYEFGAAPVLRDPLTKVGHTFSGWKDADGNDAELPATMPAEDIEIYGEFTVDQYYATFYVDGEEVDKVLTNYGEVPAAPDVADMKPGYVFQGWNPALTAMGTADVEYNAVFTASGDTPYTVEIYTMDTNGEYGAPEVENYTGATDAEATYAPASKTGFTIDTADSVLEGTITADGKLVLKVYYIRDKYTFTSDIYGSVEYYFDEPIATLETPTKEGYEFAGWSPAVPEKMPAKDITVAAQWQILEFTITFAETGDVAYEPITQDYATAIPTVKDPVKTGYTFAGWDVEIPNTMPAENITITATWTINEYTITFVDTGDVAYEPITQNYATDVDPVADPVKTGYTFKGWDVEIPETMPAVNTTVTAIWEINYYKAIFDINGTIVEKDTAYGAMPEEPNAARIGYTFDGWSPAVTAMPANDVTYVAQYTANEYDVTFDAAGGKFSNGLGSITNKVTFDTEIIAPSENPTRDGYIFVKWTPEVGTLTSTGATFTAEWQQDLSACRVTDVVRVTENVTDARRAAYAIHVKESPIKVQIACTDGSGFSWTYDRHDTKVAGDLTTSGLVAVKSYDAENNLLTAEQIEAGAVVDHEIWTIVTVLTEGTYKVRSKLTYSSESWEELTYAFDYKCEYDEVAVDTEMITSVQVAAPAVKRGTVNPVTIDTKSEVARLRITMELEDGTTRIVSYTPSSSVVEYKDNGDGTAKWVLNIKFTYSGTDDEQIQKWTVWYRETGTTGWVESDKDFEVKVTRYEPVVDDGTTEPTYAPYTVVSVSAADSVKKATYTPITIVVTSDATKIRINNQNGKATTYMQTSKNVIEFKENGDGTNTWVINYRFADVGPATWGVECRGNVWSEITAQSSFTINVTA